MSKINIVYFSGTGSTQLCAQELAAQFTKSVDTTVELVELKNTWRISLTPADKLIVMYPVYFMNAPMLVEDFINSLKQVNGTYAAVISISAGGEFTPNKACRLRISEHLSDNGYSVVYENMLVMPANCLKKLDDSASACLLKVLPQKVEKIAQDILNSKVNLSLPDFASHLASQVGRVPQKLSRYFSILFSCKQNCTACGLCVQNCPQENIYLQNDRVRWDNNCAACLRCVYQCPQQAIGMKYGSSSFLITDGYKLNKFVTQAQELSDEQVETIAKMHTERGVKKYLLED